MSFAASVCLLIPLFLQDSFILPSKGFGLERCRIKVLWRSDLCDFLGRCILRRKTLHYVYADLCSCLLLIKVLNSRPASGHWPLSEEVEFEA